MLGISSMLCIKYFSLKSFQFSRVIKLKCFTIVNTFRQVSQNSVSLTWVSLLPFKVFTIFVRTNFGFKSWRNCKFDLIVSYHSKYSPFLWKNVGSKSWRNCKFDLPGGRPCVSSRCQRWWKPCCIRHTGTYAGPRGCKTILLTFIFWRQLWTVREIFFWIRIKWGILWGNYCHMTKHPVWFRFSINLKKNKSAKLPWHRNMELFVSKF